MIYDADFERGNCPFVLQKNNFKRCKRTTSRSHEVDYFNFHFSTAFFLSFCPSIRFMKIWHCWIRICTQTSTHIHLLVNCTFSYSPDSNLFYSSFHFFFQGSAKAPSFSSLLLGVCEEERGKGVGGLVLLKKRAKVRFYGFYVNYCKKLGCPKIFRKGAWKLNNNVAFLKIARRNICIMFTKYSWPFHTLVMVATERTKPKSQRGA